MFKLIFKFDNKQGKIYYIAILHYYSAILKIIIYTYHILYVFTFFKNDKSTITSIKNKYNNKEVAKIHFHEFIFRASILV